MHPIAICANHRRRGVLRAIVLEGSPIFAAWTMIQYGWEVVEGSRKLCTPSRSAGCSATCSLKPRRRKGGLTGAFLRGRMAHHDLRVVRRRQRELQEGVALHEPEGRVRVPAAPSVRSRVHRTCPEQTVSHRANRFSPSPPSMTSRMSSGGGEGGGQHKGAPRRVASSGRKRALRTTRRTAGRSDVRHVGHDRGEIVHLADDGVSLQLQQGFSIGIAAVGRHDGTWPTMVMRT